MGYRLRKKLFVDPTVQGALLLRSAMYWLCCIAVMNVMLICWEVFATPGTISEIQFDQIWYRYAPALATSLLMLPFILLDAARISNRMVGPIYRLRDSMRKLAQGTPVAPIRFRADDFWPELADEFNELAAIVKRAQQSSDGDATVVMDRSEFPLAGAERKRR